MNDLYLAKVNPESNEYRMYRLCLPEQSYELLQQWGRIGDYIYEKWDIFTSHAAAKKQFDKLESSKRAEGYITADRAIMPRNHIFYETEKKAVDADGQLSFLNDI
jgi:predicted DNA-binding WGR domain protein